MDLDVFIELVNLWLKWAAGPLDRETTQLFDIPLYWWARLAVLLQVLTIAGLVAEYIGWKRLEKYGERLNADATIQVSIKRYFGEPATKPSGLEAAVTWTAFIVYVVFITAAAMFMFAVIAAIGFFILNTVLSSSGTKGAGYVLGGLILVGILWWPTYYLGRAWLRSWFAILAMAVVSVAKILKDPLTKRILDRSILAAALISLHFALLTS
ncbi:MAG: hypothetical protein AAFR17_17915 [Pseudomonadota bacterium]